MKKIITETSYIGYFKFLRRSLWIKSKEELEKMGLKEDVKLLIKKVMNH